MALWNTSHPGTGGAQSPVAPLTLQFLAWVARRPRTYVETMDAWRTSCPRLSIWEDALGDGLVEVETGRSRASDTWVVLTASGRVVLDQA